VLQHRPILANSQKHHCDQFLYMRHIFSSIKLDLVIC